ncbi:MAG: hypothetical protein ACI9EF_001862 [Pseudohongiellaceae bacterium]|jgi:hypothetical protein
MRPATPLLVLFTATLLAHTAGAGQLVRVTFQGQVVSNQINPAPLGEFALNDQASLTFLLDTDVFVNSPNFPTRGYEIDRDSFSLSNGTVTVGLQPPPSMTPFFVLRDNDPAVDGFLVSTNIDVPVGVPLSQTGVFGPFANATHVTYGGNLLSSLDLLGALGTYDFTGLTVFNWTIDDGPFNPLLIDFQDLTIALEGDAWSDEGNALAGVSGDPALVGSGDLSSGSVNSVELSNAAPSATAALFLALGSTPLPFKGGLLLPNPFFAPLITMTSGTGNFPLPFVMPAGAPAGTELWVQWAIQDAAAVAGVSLSNGVKGTTP